MPIVDPWEYEKPKSQEEIRQLAVLVVIMISRACRDDDSDALPGNVLHGSSIAQISVKDYILRFVKWAHLNESELIGSLIIIDRYLARTRQHITLHNIHRLIGISLIIAQKNFSDKPLKMSHLALIYGVPLPELLDIERKFLNSIEFDLFTTAEHYVHYKSRLLSLANELDRTNLVGMRRRAFFSITMEHKEKEVLGTSLFTLREKPTISKELNDAILLVSSLIGTRIGTIPHQVNPASIIFYYKSIPDLSIRDYIGDLVKDTEADEHVLIGILILLDRYLALPDKQLNLLNVHRLIAVALIVAQKSFTDMYYVMSYYSRVSRIALERLLELEDRFVSDISFDVFVSRELFLAYKHKLVLRARELEAMGYDAFQITMTPEEERLFYSNQLPMVSEKLGHTVKVSEENSVNSANVNRELIGLSLFQPGNINVSSNPFNSTKEPKHVEKQSAYSPRFSAKPASIDEKHSLSAAVGVPRL